MKNLIKKFIRNLIKRLYKIYPFIYENLFDANYQYVYSRNEKISHITEALNYLGIAGNKGKDLPLTFFEFGCYSGKTFSAAINAANYFALDQMQFFAFDSFEGLPNVNREIDGIFNTGEFKTPIDDFLEIVKRNTGLDLPKSNIIKGFYDKSLTEDLQRIMPKIGILHIDVDLYSSTVEVLEFVKPLLVPGSVILFDDWYCFPAGKCMGEKKAFNEFLENNKNFKVEEWKAYWAFGKSFFVKEI